MWMSFPVGRATKSDGRHVNANAPLRSGRFVAAAGRCQSWIAGRRAQNGRRTGHLATVTNRAGPLAQAIAGGNDMVDEHAAGHARDLPRNAESRARLTALPVSFDVRAWPVIWH
jgi:hypothetical protein